MGSEYFVQNKGTNFGCADVALIIHFHSLKRFLGHKMPHKPLNKLNRRRTHLQYTTPAAAAVAEGNWFNMYLACDDD